MLVFVFLQMSVVDTGLSTTGQNKNFENYLNNYFLQKK